jgi:hypothetical protein
MLALELGTKPKSTPTADSIIEHRTFSISAGGAFFNSDSAASIRALYSASLKAITIMQYNDTLVNNKAIRWGIKHPFRPCLL